MQVLWPPVEGYACIGEEDMIVPDVQGGAGELIFDWYQATKIQFKHQYEFYTGRTIDMQFIDKTCKLLFE